MRLWCWVVLTLTQHCVRVKDLIGRLSKRVTWHDDGQDVMIDKEGSLKYARTTQYKMVVSSWCRYDDWLRHISSREVIQSAIA
jgi:predicted N-acyltransferase